ncbi:MAG TPA: IPT/TIG domain-containing protein [Gaiellaceae bacterium]|nr:IPT/TIG domain-containing protein [Gaiellaceae bacterium]
MALTSLVVVGSALAVTVTAYSPTSGLPNVAGACPGGTITLTGTGFDADGAHSALSVSFGGGPNVDTLANGGLIFGSNTVLYAIVPNGAKTGPIVITTAAGTASTANIASTTTVGGSYAPGGTFYVNPCPQISLATATAAGGDAGVPSTPSIYKVAPTKAKVGAVVKIGGTSMLGVNGVQFGGKAAKYTIVSATEIDATVPKGAVSGPLTLTYSITASTSQGGTTPTNAAGNSSCAKCTTVWENIGLGKAKTFTVLK